MAIPALLIGLVTKLAEEGLSTVGNAILAKGKDVVEDKLGVKIPDDPAQLTPELTAQLRIKAMEHEEFLVTSQLDDRRIDLRTFELETADRASARKRESDVNQSANASWLTKNLTSILALIVVVGGGLIICFSNDNDVKYGVFTLMGMTLSYYFGTSMGSTKAQQLMRDQLANKK
jgi:hypothetical protein